MKRPPDKKLVLAALVLLLAASAAASKPEVSFVYKDVAVLKANRLP